MKKSSTAKQSTNSRDDSSVNSLLASSEKDLNGSNKGRVLLGMNYSIDSIVTAFLLKNQKYDVIGLGVDFLNQDLIKKYGLNIPNCQIEDLDKLENLCEKIGIPFYATDARPVFEEEVLQKSITNRLIGAYPNPCFTCRQIIVYLLYKKMRPLKCDFISMGICAKIRKNLVTGKFYIHRGADPLNDQSSFLGRIDPKVLESMLLPLGDLQKKEVRRIFNGNFPVEKFPDFYDSETGEKLEAETKECSLLIDPVKTVEEMVPDTIRIPGRVMVKDDEDEEEIGEHAGIYQYEQGGYVDWNHLVSSPHKVEEVRIVDLDFEKNIVYLQHDDDKQIRFFHVKIVRKSNDLMLYCPNPVFCRIGKENEITAGTIYGKSVDFAIISIKKLRDPVLKGTPVFFYSDASNNARLIGTAMVLGQGNLESKAKSSEEETDEEDPIELLKRTENDSFKI